MKVDFYDLKQGDKIWIGDWGGPIQLIAVSYEPNRDYMLPRWELSDGRKIDQYISIFTTKEEAIDDLLPKLRKQQKILQEQFDNLKSELEFLDSEIKEYEKCLN